ncbi:prolipoprotein diacylglyceryl transferase [Desulfonatronum lacustre]|uniref:prolipoprotein diacylglyceryl transferase n=1 Tax=Desulfonatronum lacustre TaxID=66849 RepID=UPI0004904077|nr:prolipoprotein diacylglyceryl transferase [Desulfonatronum lacustre]SMP71885.1 phosphatidylglycerol:prolipoprotein diacylglycerol transferase [Desulfonatronum zhilinae]
MYHPNIDPVAFALGPLEVRWYGLMYLIGFLAAWLLGHLRAKRPGSGWNPQELPDLITYCALGLLLGARLGYVLFYDFATFIDHPLEILKIWKGGMSFHGGLLGVMLAIWLYALRSRRSFFQVADFVAPLAPIGICAGRIGNFINGELWGRATDAPWGMIFADPNAGFIPRHPSQLYQAFLEGLVLFALLWSFSAKPRPTMAVSGLFALLYGVFRFSVEFFREPDAHLGFVAFDWMSMGQVLSLPMIALGGVLLWLAGRRKEEVRSQKPGVRR